jgi:hypothetical protein
MLCCRFRLRKNPSDSLSANGRNGRPKLWAWSGNPTFLNTACGRMKAASRRPDTFWKIPSAGTSWTGLKTGHLSILAMVNGPGFANKVPYPSAAVCGGMVEFFALRKTHPPSAASGGLGGPCRAATWSARTAGTSGRRQAEAVDSFSKSGDLLPLATSMTPDKDHATKCLLRRQTGPQRDPVHHLSPQMTAISARTWMFSSVSLSCAP